MRELHSHYKTFKTEKVKFSIKGVLNWEGFISRMQHEKEHCIQLDCALDYLWCLRNFYLLPNFLIWPNTNIRAIGSLILSLDLNLTDGTNPLVKALIYQYLIISITHFLVCFCIITFNLETKKSLTSFFWSLNWKRNRYFESPKSLFQSLKLPRAIKSTSYIHIYIFISFNIAWGHAITVWI